jgi:hypothetical protein
MAKKSDKKNAEDSSSEINPQNMAGSLLKDYADDHLNFEERIEYKVPTGSFIFDKFLGGGLPCGLHRFGGDGAEVGKSSCALECMKNHLSSKEYDVRGVFFDSEGKLNQETKERSGVKFVYDTNDWERGTCLVIDTNVFEFVLKFTDSLMKNNPLKVRYFFVLDSMDSVGLRKDIAKEIDEDAKVAGAPKLFKQYAQKMGTTLGKLGHIFIVTAQKTASISIDPRTPPDTRQMNASGGHGIEHQALWAFYFLNKRKDDLIVENPELKRVEMFNNKILGHKCNILIKKSINEKTGVIASYYIKYGRTGGKSVWIEREIGDVLIGSGLLARSGSWFAFQEDFHKEMIEKGLEVPEKVQGIEKVYGLLEEKPELVEFVKEKFKHLSFDEIVQLST